jgi:hypothetical protein
VKLLRKFVPAFCIFLTALSASCNQNKEKHAQHGIDADTVANYEKLGFWYGGFKKIKHDIIPAFDRGLEEVEGALPGFRTKAGGYSSRSELPKVHVPFGLDFSSRLSDDDAKNVARLNKLALLNLNNSFITDVGLKELTALKELTSLGLWNSKVTDAGLKEMAAFKELTSLDLGATGITDEGMKEIAQLKGLRHLSLIQTKVTDAGLADLAELKNLTTLWLQGPKITEEGVAKLQKALPKCKIDRKPPPP